MKQETIFVLFIISILTTLSLFNLISSLEPKEKIQFKVWKELMQKIYTTIEEEEYRFKIFNTNLAYVKDHNIRYGNGLQTYELEMNKFADLKEEEFAAIYLMKQTTKNGIKATKNCTGSQPSSKNLPDTVDWSSKGAVTSIKNQGQCGSCWAFSATGSTQGAHFIKEGTLDSYSEQQLVDCSYSYGNHGCAGGLMDYAFFYIIDNGITLQKNYPYHGLGQKCRYNATTDKAWQISNCVDITVDKQDSLKSAIAQQPVSVAIEANHISFQLYRQGVYSGNCGTKLDHGVLAVGYGVMDGKNYWKVKNSWGASWGQNGYIYIERNGDGKGKCGIQTCASIPLP